MRKVFLFVLCALFLVDVESSISQDKPEIKGTVFMPAMAIERRKFRGRMYRNRLSSKKSKEKIIKVVEKFKDSSF